MYEIFKEPLNALAFTDVILLHINQLRFSATLVVVLRVTGTNIQTQSNVLDRWEGSQKHNSYLI